MNLFIQPVLLFSRELPSDTKFSGLPLYTVAFVIGKKSYCRQKNNYYNINPKNLVHRGYSEIKNSCLTIPHQNGII